MRLKLAGAAFLALGAMLATGGAAEARDGCGPGFHLGFYGYCRPNAFYRPIVYRPAFYGYRRVGWYGPRWHRWGYRYVGWHRPYGWGYRPIGWGWRW
ncbi:GCG_CRPN prefix-to-repeats domain-containing protein [Methylobacterium nigriterrae]|uniref:GCG_CRPN prefix-to-repeats domain-containing protein n=1 Tax=Methylobacterium nigriterrae TaxID=3127512 RepID=UPI0030140A5E